MVNDPVHGTLMLYPTVGTAWYSNWHNGKARQVKVNGKGRSQPNLDPYDSWADLHCHSFSEEGNWMQIDGKGVCKLMGPHPRLHIHKPSSSSNLAIWRNTEMTCYCYVPSSNAFMSGPYSTFDLRTRSNHHLEHLCRCNGLSYISTVNLMKSFHGFRKEFLHDNYCNTGNTKFALPKNKWFGQKFICKDYASGTKVRLEKYLDLAGNNTWTKVGEFKDTGNWGLTSGYDHDTFTQHNNECKNGCVDGKMTGGASTKKIILRTGRDAYLRTDYAKNIMFKKFSIREIASWGATNFP